MNERYTADADRDSAARRELGRSVLALERRVDGLEAVAGELRARLDAQARTIAALERVAELQAATLRELESQTRVHFAALAALEGL